MLDKTITSALLQLRAKIIREGLDGLPHVDALLIARGVDLQSQHITKPRPANKLARRAMFQAITDCLQDGPKRGRDIAAYIANRELSISYAQAMRRVHQGRLAVGGLQPPEKQRWLPTLVASHTGPVPISFWSGSHVKRPFVQKPRGFSSLKLNVCGGGYRSR